MKKSLIATAIVGGLGGFALRKLQLAHSFDAMGLIARGDGISTGLYALCVLAALVACFLCAHEPQREARSAEGRKSQRGILILIAALGLIGSYLPLPLGAGAVTYIVPALALASACAMAVEGVLTLQGQTGSLLGGCVLPVYLGALLISDYRSWSYEPVVANFCFTLLFLVCTMLATYHLAAFRVGIGKRRLTLFYTTCALVFAGTVLANGDLHTIVRVASLCLYLAAAIWPHLETPPAPEPEKPEEKPAE